MVVAPELLFQCHERGYEVLLHPHEAVVFTVGLTTCGWPELCAAEALAGCKAETAMLLADIAARAHDDPSFTPRVRVPFCPPGESPDDLVIVGLDAVQARVMAPVATAIAKKLETDDVNFMALEIAG